MGNAIRFGIIGTNFISENFAKASAFCNITLQAVFSRSMETGRAYAQKYGIPDVYDDFDAFVKAPNIDAVYVASPNYAHCEQSVRAMEQRKHVLCEKPVASNLRELQRMISASMTNNVVLLEAMIPAHDPAYQIVRECMGKIGKVRRAIFELCKYSSRYDQFRQGVILNAFEPALSNAAIMDIGVYCIHPCVKLFGKPLSIKASSVLLYNGMEGEGTVSLRYADMVADLIYSKITESARPCVIQGEEGSVQFFGVGGPRNIVIEYRGGIKEEITVERPYPNMVNELREFLRLIEAKEVEHDHLQYSQWTMAIIDEARRQNNVVFPADL